MTAIESHHFSDLTSPRARWRAHYSAVRASRRHAHDGRAEVWQLALIGLTIFWAAIAYVLHAVT